MLHFGGGATEEAEAEGEGGRVSGERPGSRYLCRRCLKIAGPFHGSMLRLEANLVVRPLELRLAPSHDWSD